MLQFFLNPLMLLGLAGVALPVIAHLLSRRRFEVVEWGAMQFLDPSRRTRRRLKLEELLLLLVRIGLIAMLALAAARPWIATGFLTGYRSGGSRDIVLVIDGSNSMARSNGLTTLHQNAVRRATEFLSTLEAGDTVALIDARDRPVSVIGSPLHDHAAVREALDNLPPPAGAASLQAACEQGVGILSRSSSGSRELIVLTDRHRVGWDVGNDGSWERFDDLLQFPAVRPRVWVVDCSEGLAAIGQNVSVGQLNLSRDLTVPGFPVRFQVTIRNSGSAAVDVPVHVLVDGQQLAEHETRVQVPANGETQLDLEHRFASAGTRRLTVSVEAADDQLTIDNSANAAVRVTSAIPVLLVESSRSLSVTDGQTFFAAAALTAEQNKSPWVNAKVVRADQLTAADIDAAAVVVLPDVDRLPPGIPQTLTEFVHRGNGVFICLGPGTTAETFQSLYVEPGLLPPLQLKRIREADPDSPEPVRILPYSLQSGWLDRFRIREDSSFLKTTFEKWWLLETTVPAQETDPPADGAAAGAVADAEAIAAKPVDPPVALAQLTTGDPLLLSSRSGDGSVLLLTTTLDTRWNNLPARPDYVPFLHEAIFHQAASRVRRNVSFGEPLLTTLQPPVADEVTAEQALQFSGPFDRQFPADVRVAAAETVAVLPATSLPGVYELRQQVTEPEAAERPMDVFVVNYDHAEDQPGELTQDDRSRLIVNNRMTFVESADKLAQQMYGDESRSELWALLLFSFLGLLLLELWMTRRLVIRGHGGLEHSTPPAAAE